VIRFLKWGAAAAAATLVAVPFAAVGSVGPAAATTGGVRAAAAGPTFTYQTLDDSADPTFNQLLGINDVGVIAGYFGAGDAAHPNKGYTLAAPFTQAGYSNENVPGSVQTQVTGIDTAGDTVGFWVDGAGVNHGFTDVGGTFTTVDNPATTASPAFNQLLGLNNHGVAVGFYNDTAGNAHGYTYNLATKVFTVVAPTGAVSTTATGINDNGDVSGFSADANMVTTGFLLAGGTYTTLADPGAKATNAFGVNNADTVVGSFTDSAGTTHGFWWAGGLFTTLDDPNGTTTLNGLNNQGDVVGFYVGGDGNTHGLLAVDAVSGTSPVVSRIFGVDRVATAIAVSQRTYPSTGSAGAVVLVRKDGFADALAGTALAVKKKAPILSTDTTALDPRTQAEIQRVLPAGGTVYLLGGAVALATNIGTTLQSLGFSVVRFSGDDRFGTSVLIANALGDPLTMLLADGTNFPDALAAGAAAAHVGGTVITTNGPVLTPEVSAYLDAHKTATLTAIGGPAAAADPAAKPLVGANRYATSVLVAQTFFNGPPIVGVAAGTVFADALSGGAASAVSGGPMVLTDPTALSAETQGYIHSLGLGVGAVNVYGGPNSLYNTVLVSLQHP